MRHDVFVDMGVRGVTLHLTHSHNTSAMRALVSSSAALEVSVCLSVCLLWGVNES